MSDDSQQLQISVFKNAIVYSRAFIKFYTSRGNLKLQKGWEKEGWQTLEWEIHLILKCTALINVIREDTSKVRPELRSLAAKNGTWILPRLERKSKSKRFGWSEETGWKNKESRLSKIATTEYTVYLARAHSHPFPGTALLICAPEKIEASYITIFNQGPGQCSAPVLP